MSTLARPVSGDDHADGPDPAVVTLIEYGDFECPHCGHAYPIVEKIRARFSGGLRFVYRHFPLDRLHPHAELAAEASEAAAAQGRFWEMHAALFRHQTTLDESDVVRYATQIGLDLKRFSASLQASVNAGHVREDFQGGLRSGVDRTPTFFINGIRYDGILDFGSLEEAILSAGRTALTGR